MRGLLSKKNIAHLVPNKHQIDVQMCQSPPFQELFYACLEKPVKTNFKETTLHLIKFSVLLMFYKRCKYFTSSETLPLYFSQWSKVLRVLPRNGDIEIPPVWDVDPLFIMKAAVWWLRNTELHAAVYTRISYEPPTVICPTLSHQTPQIPPQTPVITKA